eukprot:791877-Pyramimonas_sp.AAC.1
MAGEEAGGSNIQITFAKMEKGIPRRQRGMHVTNVRKLPDDEAGLNINKQNGVSLSWPSSLGAEGVKALWERAVKITSFQSS